MKKRDMRRAIRRASETADRIDERIAAAQRESDALRRALALIDEQDDEDEDASLQDIASEPDAKAADAATARIGQLEGDLGEAMRRLCEAEDKLAKTESERDKAKDELAKTAAELGDVKASLEKAMAAKQPGKADDDVRKKLAEAVKDAKAANDAAAAATAKLEEARKGLKAARDKASAAKRDADAAHADAKAARAEADAARADAERASARLDAASLSEDDARMIVGSMLAAANAPYEIADGEKRRISIYISESDYTRIKAIAEAEDTSPTETTRRLVAASLSVVNEAQE